jgi:hypothetical protein
MKNTLGQQFYFFQARRGGPTRVRWIASGLPVTRPRPGLSSAKGIQISGTIGFLTM